MAKLDRDGGGGATGFKLTNEAGRFLALWMCYEDVIRVADLKIRETRSARVRREVQLGDQQLMTVTEYMHPRLQEVCETLPAPIGRFILNRPGLSKPLNRFFRKGSAMSCGAEGAVANSFKEKLFLSNTKKFTFYCKFTLVGMSCRMKV